MAGVVGVLCRFAHLIDSVAYVIDFHEVWLCVARYGVMAAHIVPIRLLSWCSICHEGGPRVN